jgi:hypothetical protein
VLPLAALLLGGRIHADVLPPPAPLSCGPGEDATVRHGGARCEPRQCQSDVVCPVGMTCLARSETECDPRGKPCTTNVVRRCTKADAPVAAPGCPREARPDKQRSERVLAQLGRHERGKHLLGRLGRELTICYGDVREGVVQSLSVLLLQRDRTVAENAARLGHLLVHLVELLPFDEAAAREGTVPCPQLVERADQAERRAHAVESELRQSFALAPLPFEDLSAEYRARCRALRRK